MREKIGVSIILVNWNGGQVIIDCIEFLTKTVKKHSYEIIVVDNNSKDKSLNKIEKRFPEVKIIKNKFNNMFAGANNQGYEISNGKYIFILNTDTIVTKGAVDDLVGYLEKNNQDIVTCTLLNKDGTIQYNMHRGFPTFIRLFTSLIYKNYGFLGFLPSVKNYLLINNKFDKDFYVDQAAGAAILISRKLVKDLGYLFDEKNFPLFYNDVDLCYRVHKKGIKILCKTDVKIFHLKGESVKKLNNYTHLSIYSKAASIYFKKYNKYINYLMITLIFRCFFVLFLISSYLSYFFGKLNKSKLTKIQNITINKKAILEKF